jgi:hypothetical protein
MCPKIQTGVIRLTRSRPHHYGLSLFICIDYGPNYGFVNTDVKQVVFGSEAGPNHRKAGQGA